MTALLLAVALGAACVPSSDERRGTIYELKAEPNERNVDRIREMLDDGDRDVRATAMNALVGLRVPDATDVARAGLDDEDGFVRATAAKLLADLQAREHADALAGVLLNDSDAVARQRAAEALTRLGGARAVEALAAALGDPIEAVRRAAVDGIADLDPTYAREDLTRLLVADAVWEIRAEAAHALGLTGDPEVLDDLRAALDDPNEFVRSAVANALRIHAEVVDRDSRSK